MAADRGRPLPQRSGDDRHELGLEPLGDDLDIGAGPGKAQRAGEAADARSDDENTTGGWAGEVVNRVRGSVLRAPTGTR